MQGAFPEESDSGVSSLDLMQLADELSEENAAQSDGDEINEIDEIFDEPEGGMTDLNQLAEEIRMLNADAASYDESDDEDQDVKVYVKDSSAEEDAEVDDLGKTAVFALHTEPEDLGKTAVFELNTEPELIDLNAAQPDDGLEHTSVFDPVRPQPTYGETAGRYNRYPDAPKPRKKYGVFRGLALIAVLLGVVFGLTWLLSKVALSVMGEDDSVSAESYDYHTSSVVINSFDDDDEQGAESMLIPEFTAEKLTVGNSGEMVLAVQRTLASLGYLTADSVTGRFDNDTKNAVKQFQKANYLDATGEVNRETYDLIFDANATAPTTRTTDLPTTTEAETSETQTTTSAAETTTAAGKETTASASVEASKPTEALPSQEESSDSPSSDTGSTEDADASVNSSDSDTQEPEKTENTEGKSGNALKG